MNVIDLANIYSCSFMATDDVGSVFADGGLALGPGVVTVISGLQFNGE